MFIPLHHRVAAIMECFRDEPQERRLCHDKEAHAMYAQVFRQMQHLDLNEVEGTRLVATMLVYLCCALSDGTRQDAQETLEDLYALVLSMFPGVRWGALAEDDA